MSPSLHEFNMKSIVLLFALGVTAAAGSHETDLQRTVNERIMAAMTSLALVHEQRTPLHLGYTSYYISSKKVNWHRALQSCLERGWDLASIDSPLEQDMLVNYLKSNGLADEWFWLAGTDQGVEGEFHWMKMRQAYKPINFTNWASGQPDNHQGDEDCLVLTSINYHGSTWHDRPCSQEQYYICQQPR